MAYFLQVTDENNNYKSLRIEWTDIFRNEKLKKTYTGAGAFDLEEIDKFTTLFKNEEELKAYLIASKRLSPSATKQSLVINFLKKNKVKSSYEVLYEDDLLYIIDPNELITVIENEYSKGNIEFINLLAKYFLFVEECKVTATKLIEITELFSSTGIRDDYFDKVDFNGDNVIRRLAKIIVYRYNEDLVGKIMYKDEFNWRTIHLLIEFIKNYEARQDNLSNDIQVKHKMRVKEK